VIAAIALRIAFRVSCDDFRFRWASCQLENLRDCDEQDVPETLGTLPSTLNETYERTLKNIKESKRKYAQYIFQFLTVSARPLSVQELAEVFAIGCDGSEGPTGTLEFEPSRRKQDADSEIAVRTTCPSLISIDDIDGEKRVRFSHFSVREFLTSVQPGGLHSTHLSSYHVSPQLAHTFSAKLCLSVLLTLNDRIVKDRVNVMVPLATYAAEHWVKHANCGDPSSLVQLKGGMSRLFDKKNPQFAAWIWVYDLDNPSGPHLIHTRPRKPETSPLYYAALCGFSSMVEYLAKSHPGDVNTRGRDGRTPLHAALRNGHSDTALALLKKGADAGARDGGDETPLHIASSLGDVEVMKSLFNYELKLDVKNKKNETPLSLAASNGSLEAVRVLVGRLPGLVKKEVAPLKRTALHVATVHGHKHIAQFLLASNADSNAKDENHRTPLHLAADQGKDDIARLLLQNKAKVNVRDESNLTPLHLASSGGQLEVVEVLLEDPRVHVNDKDGDRWSALHMAAYNGYLQVVALLIQHDANLDCKNNESKTPQDLASEGRHSAVVAKLERVGNSHQQTWDHPR